MTSVQGAVASPREGSAFRSRLIGAASGPLPLVALFAVASAVLARYALHVHTWQPDEVIYVFQGRALAHDFPSALWNTHLFEYGIERLNPFYGALTTWLFSTTATAMQAQKVLIAISFAS